MICDILYPLQFDSFIHLNTGQLWRLLMCHFWGKRFDYLYIKISFEHALYVLMCNIIMKKQQGIFSLGLLIATYLYDYMDITLDGDKNQFNLLKRLNSFVVYITVFYFIWVSNAFCQESLGLQLCLAAFVELSGRSLDYVESWSSIIHHLVNVLNLLYSIVKYLVKIHFGLHHLNHH